MALIVLLGFTVFLLTAPVYAQDDEAALPPTAEAGETVTEEPEVRAGQEVALRVEHSGAQARGKVTMVTPFVDEVTRSATARVVLDNSDGRWLPGTFVTGFISTSKENLPVVVSRDAVQSIEGRDVVFVEHEDGLEMTPVKLGRSDRTNVEITAGLTPGMPYVSKGAFQLKATVITSTLDSHAGHGH